MVAFNVKNQKGNGVLDTLMKPFTVERYAGEQHARSLDPHHFLQGYSYVGPHTQLKLREKLHDDVPLNDLDSFAKEHDYSYQREYDEYQKDHDRPQHLRNIWKADDEFVEHASNSRDDPIIGNLSAKLISAKENLEKKGILDTKKFEGFGKRDPTHRLKMIAMKQNDQEGGFAWAPLIPILAPILGSLAGKAFDAIYNKIKGSGYSIPYHRTEKDRLEFLKKLINHIG
jgi:hypothetical protein